MLKKALKLLLIVLSFILFVVISVNLYRTWDRYNPIDYWLVKYGYNEFIPPHSLPKTHKLGAPELIAHGGGEIDGIKYTNSREAFLQSIAYGYKFIEIDFKETIEGELFGAHSTREFRERTDLLNIGHIPPTNAQVRKSKIDGKYTPLFLRDIYEILKEHPDVYLVTDKSRAYKAMLEQFPLPQQLIVETFLPGQYYRALKAGILYPTFSGGPKELREHKATLSVKGVKRWHNDSEVRKWAAEPNHTVLVLTYNDCNNIDFPQGTLLYTDRCLPKKIK